MSSSNPGPVPAAVLAQLALALDDAFEANDRKALTHEALVGIAKERATTVGRCYAATLLAPEVAIAETCVNKVVFCAGECQKHGSLECLDRAADDLEARRASGQEGFDIAVRQCLKKCDRAAACEIRTPDGTAVLTETTSETLSLALSAL